MALADKLDADVARSLPKWASLPDDILGMILARVQDDKLLFNRLAPSCRAFQSVIYRFKFRRMCCSKQLLPWPVRPLLVDMNGTGGIASTADGLLALPASVSVKAYSLDELMGTLRAVSRGMQLPQRVHNAAIPLFLTGKANLVVATGADCVVTAMFVACVSAESTDAIEAICLALVQLVDVALPVAIDLIYLMMLAARQFRRDRRRRLVEEIEIARLAIFGRIAPALILKSSEESKNNKEIERKKGSDPTSEQCDIIDLDVLSNRSFKVLAFAGTGKTWTLQQAAIAWLKKHPKLRILYLAFNKKAADEAHQKFDGVSCRTINSLAFNGIGLSPEGQRKVIQCRRDIRYLAVPRSWHIPFPTAVRAKEILEEWLKSADDALPRSASSDQDSQALHVAKRLWEAVQLGTEPISHDVYLKLYQLLKPNLAPIYDVILLDEAQDVNQVMKAILTPQTCTRVCVGDINQQIYGFRGTCNMLEVMASAHTYTLSKSFRLGTVIAEICNRILAMCGTDIYDSHIHIVAGNGPGRVQEGPLEGMYTILARSNAQVWMRALSAHRNDKKKVHIVGDVDKSDSGTFNLYCQVALLMAGRQHLVTHYRLKNMTKAQLVRLASKDDDGTDFDDTPGAKTNKDLARAVKFYDQVASAGYGDVFDALVDLSRNLATIVNAELLISNVHQSKGLEYDQVEIANDFVDLSDVPHLLAHLDREKVVEEINLLYVAVSRTRLNLRIPSNNDLRRFLDNTGGLDRIHLACTVDKPILPDAPDDGPLPRCGICLASSPMHQVGPDETPSPCLSIVRADGAVACDKCTYVPFLKPPMQLERPPRYPGKIVKQPRGLFAGPDAKFFDNSSFSGGSSKFGYSVHSSLSAASSFFGRSSSSSSSRKRPRTSSKKSS